MLAGWLAPGAAVVALLGLGRDPLERLVLAMAIGRILLAIVSLAAVSTFGPATLHVWAVLGSAAWWLARTRLTPSRAAGVPSAIGTQVALALAACAAFLLVSAVVGRGGLVGADGALVFFGRDSTNDPLVYASLARQIYETGLPVVYPFMSAATTTTTYVPYGVMVGLHSLGVPLLDVVMRVVPLVEMAGLAVAAVALVRHLGGGALASAVGGVLVVLGGDPSFWLQPIGSALGIGVQPLDTWSFFGPYLFAFNPVTPALQMTFAAFLLLGGLARMRDPLPRRAAVTAGVLVAFLFETKLFIWAPVIGGLGLLAFRGAPQAIRPAVRLSAIVAAFASLPFLAEKLAWARALAGRDLTAFQLCPGCVPSYLADAAIGSHQLSFQPFELFYWGQLADPVILAKTLGAVVLMWAVALGARAVALPSLWRGMQNDDPGRALLHRWVGAACVLGLGAAAVFTTRPHYLNGLQFSWIATAGLWPFVAIAVARWIHERRLPALLVTLALVVPGAWHAIDSLGFAAPPSHAVSADEVAFMSTLRESVPAGEVVLEPSVLLHKDFPSPVTWEAGRSVLLSLVSASKVIPEGERLRRGLLLETIFTTEDRRAALDAIAASEAHWIYAPVAAPLRFATAPDLEEVASGPAGALYRVAGAAGVAR